MTRAANLVKRATDICLGVILLVLVLPIIVVGTIGAAVALRTQPFFTQTRVGRNGKPFRMIKIRTLPTSVPRYAAKHDLVDVRLPWFTSMLRALHLDELPQLFLVVIGKMSLVGPRPEMPYLYENFDPEFAARRIAARPGCTGLWQISDRCHRMIFEHPEFDEYYLAHRSTRLDLWIMLRSVRLLVPLGRPALVSYHELVPPPVTRLDRHTGAGPATAPAYERMWTDLAAEPQKEAVEA